MITPTQLTALRALRLHHWHQVIHWRKIERRETRAASRKRADVIARIHLGYVQTLDEFFPAGDTADRDHAWAKLEGTNSRHTAIAKAPQPHSTAPTAPAAPT